MDVQVFLKKAISRLAAMRYRKYKSRYRVIEYDLIRQTVVNNGPLFSCVKRISGPHTAIMHEATKNL